VAAKATHGDSLIARLRRRRGWAIGVLAVGLALTALLALRSEPAHRATGQLALAGLTVPAAFDAEAAADHVVDHLHTVRDRLGGAQRSGAAVGMRVHGIELGSADANGLRRVSARITLNADHADGTQAERALRALRDELLAYDRSAVIDSGAAGEALEMARSESARLAADLRAAERALESFERENAAALPGFERLNAEAIREAQRERATLDSRRAQLEGRRNELDRGLADMRSDYRRLNPAAPLSSASLTARQMELAYLRGMFGPAHEPAVDLAREIDTLQGAANARLAEVTEQLRAARVHLATMERLHPPDHPDVIGATYQVSLLEIRVADATIAGLSNNDRNYIEGLARERRDIDATIENVRGELAALDERLAAHQARVDEAPVIGQRHGALRQQLAELGEREAAARQRLEALEREQRIAAARSPGQLSAAGDIAVRGVVFSDPATIGGFGGVLTLFSMLLLVGVVDRVDRRVIGAAAIERLQGRRPLGEIPRIEAARPKRGAQAEH
jgi:hypothetical protein